MRRLVVLLALVVAAGGCRPGIAAGAGWRWPLHGDVVVRFSAGDADPFAAGRHRGIVIAAGARARVRSACAGRVTFAGPVGRAGLTVSVSCGRLRATYQGLAATAVGRGDRVGAGSVIATLGEAGILRLGARRERPRSGPRRYVDPLALLRERPPAAGPLGRAPRGRADRPRRDPPAAVPAPVRVPVPVPARPALPLAAWAGLALLALAAPSGALVRRQRARRASAAQAWPVGG